MGIAILAAGLAAGRGSELLNGALVGLAIFVVAFLAMALARARRFNTVLGAWAVASPFALQYRDQGVGWATILAGAVVVASSLFG